MTKKERNSGNGFTLLELLLSLTILSVIIVIVFGAFRVGVRAWEKGESETDHQQRTRIVLNLIREQLASLYRPVRSSGSSEAASGLTGDTDTVAFLSRRPILPENRFRTVYVRYRVENGVESQRLLLREVPYDGMSVDDEMIPDNEYQELLDGFHSFEFEYIRPAIEEKSGMDDDFIHQNVWNAEAEKGLPRAVRVIFQDKPDTAPISVLASLGTEDGKETPAIFGGGKG